MSIFGSNYRVSTFGESHSKFVGVVIDGFPSRFEISEKNIQKQLDRRRPGQSMISTERNESDELTIVSGVEMNKTMGSPICVFVKNLDHIPSDYNDKVLRPSHADLTYRLKYGIHASSGGGRSSARESIGRVIAGSIAEQFLFKNCGVEIVAWTSSVGNIDFVHDDDFLQNVSRQDVDQNIVRCPDPISTKMIDYISKLKELGDSVGGTISCVCRNLPTGLGEPVFDKLEAKLGHAMLSIPATKAFEIGSGFRGTCMRGSEHNDIFIYKEGRIRTKTNNSGGVQGGISNGENIFFRVGFKPVSTIKMKQQTVNLDGNTVTLDNIGRHDPCVVNRAIPIVESMTSIVLMDMILLHNSKTF